MRDISIAEWCETDMNWWHEMAQAMTSWIAGKQAGGGVEQDRQELAQKTGT